MCHSSNKTVSRKRWDKWKTNFCLGVFTEQEIKNAIWSCDSNGSPGPDGFTFGFSKENWNTLKGDIVTMMDDFFLEWKDCKRIKSLFHLSSSEEIIHASY